LTRLAAERVVIPNGVVAPGVVEIDGERIAAVVPTTGPVPERTLVPGFVDLQVNGHDDVDVWSASGSDWERLDHLLLAQGVTAWCPTLTTAPLAEYGPALNRIEEAAQRPAGGRPAILGAHLEGPFLGGRPGAHPPEWIVPLDEAWLAALPPIVRIITLAPEVDGAADAIRSLTERGLLVALGHSTAAYEEAVAATDAGARLVTHLFNGMEPAHHRQPGLAGAALTDDRLAVSVIADLVHVHPAALRLAFRAKPKEKIALVTDAVAWRSPRSADRDVGVRDGAPRLPDGTLAGSALTMDTAVRNAVDHAGIALDDAIAAASTTPADLLHARDRGRLETGARADIVALGRGLEVRATWLAGRQVAG